MRWNISLTKSRVVHGAVALYNWWQWWWLTDYGKAGGVNHVVAQTRGFGRELDTHIRNINNNTTSHSISPTAGHTSSQHIQQSKCSSLTFHDLLFFPINIDVDSWVGVVSKVYDNIPCRRGMVIPLVYPDNPDDGVGSGEGLVTGLHEQVWVWSDVSGLVEGRGD